MGTPQSGDGGNLRAFFASNSGSRSGGGSRSGAANASSPGQSVQIGTRTLKTARPLDVLELRARGALLKKAKDTPAASLRSLPLVLRDHISTIHQLQQRFGEGSSATKQSTWGAMLSGNMTMYNNWLTDIRNSSEHTWYSIDKNRAQVTNLISQYEGNGSKIGLHKELQVLKDKMRLWLMNQVRFSHGLPPHLYAVYLVVMHPTMSGNDHPRQCIGSDLNCWPSLYRRSRQMMLLQIRL